MHITAIKQYKIYQTICWRLTPYKYGFTYNRLTNDQIPCKWLRKNGIALPVVFCHVETPYDDMDLRDLIKLHFNLM
jgi:hypothetical protein